MYKLIFIVLVVIGLALYFTGALDFDNSTDNMSISVDTDKAKELAESIKEQIEE